MTVNGSTMFAINTDVELPNAIFGSDVIQVNTNTRLWATLIQIVNCHV